MNSKGHASLNSIERLFDGLETSSTTLESIQKMVTDQMLCMERSELLLTYIKGPDHAIFPIATERISSLHARQVWMPFHASDKTSAKESSLPIPSIPHFIPGIGSLA